MTLKINNSVLFPYSKKTETLFHPKATMDRKNGIVVMTVQTIGGSDYYGPIQVCYSNDKCISWTYPEMIPSLGWHEIGNGMIEGVCDVVPDYHSGTGKVLTVGHNVYYKDGKFCDTLGAFTPEDKSSLPRYSVYSVLDSDGVWSPRRRIHFEEFEKCSAFVCGCAQKVFLPDGKIVIPFVIGYESRRDCSVCSLLCEFDGQTITPLKRGNMLENPVDRGLLEPSLIEFENKYYMTIRAEDGCGYVAESNDGLNWGQIKAWQWKNGKPLCMSTTQQHWLVLGGRLYLVYTRKTELNTGVVRWRSPMFIAEVDTGKLCLKYETEQTVFPMCGDIANPKTVPLMGNFMPLALSETEAIITDGDILPFIDYSGNVLMVRLQV